MLKSTAQAASAVDQRVTFSAYYALVVVTLANVLNYLDRNIVSILAEAIKHDLRLDDAEMGFLLGTAFAVFYAVVGLAMGGIADKLPRRGVMACGVTLWSAMTMLGGAATNFLMLSVARFGVGVGEATTNPCAHSLLTDTFPKRNWSLALGFYLSSAFLGGSAALAIGGYFLQHWGEMCTGVPIAGACGLAGWKAALFAVGAPGLVVALLLLTIREPARPRPPRGTAATVVDEFSVSVPLLSLVPLARLGGGAALRVNARLAGLIAAVAAALALVTGDEMQWIALGVGAYAIATWAQLQRHRDKPLFALTFGDRSFVLTVLSITLIGSITGTLSFWSAPYAMRTFKALTPVQIGTALAAVHVVSAVGGVLLGGWITDKWKAKSVTAPIRTARIVLASLVPVVLLMLWAPTFPLFLLGYFLLGLVTPLHMGGFHALVQELVLPRMRGSATACQTLIGIVVIFGIGPYFAGKISTLTGSLSAGLVSLLVLVPIALTVLFVLARRLPGETPEKRLATAAAAGEASE